MQKRTLWLTLAFWMVCAAAAHALPTGPVVSGDGKLQFSNFQFFSPFNSVDEDDVDTTVLPDGLRFSGPITSTDDLKTFFVLYEVSTIGPTGTNNRITGASLQLESDVEAEKFGVVLSTKRLIGDVGDPSDWFNENGKAKNGKAKKDKSNARGDFGFGHDFDSDFPLGPFGGSLGHLKTADWDISKKFRPPLGLGKDGAIRLAEAGFAAQQSIRVIEKVVVAAKDGTATWTSSTNRFRVVPEPGTATLMLLGFGLIALRSRRGR